VAIERGAANADRLGDLLHGVLAASQQLAGDPQLVVGDDRTPPPVAAAGASRLQASLRALADELTLELRDGAEDVEHQPAGGGRGIDPLREAAEAELPLLELADQIDQMPQRPAEPIQPPNHERILAVAQLLKRPRKLRSIL
jgi:hypothetical protein